MRLRQIALVAEHLDKAAEEIRAVLGLDYAYADPAVAKYGLNNAVFPIGDTFLEVVSPNRPGTTAGRLLEKRRGDGGYMVILQVGDIAEARARIRAQGARIVEQADFDGVAMSHVHPKDVGGAILSVDYMNPKERWEWGGPVWRDHVRTNRSLTIAGAELQAEDPDAMSARWSAVLGQARARAGTSWRIALDEGGVIDFVPALDGRGDGLGAFSVAVRNPLQVQNTARELGLLDSQGEVVLSGTRVRLTQ